ncbi:hypothetical protein DPMN_026106 [Dreissena polymorpha]|uniref:Uncharacterized protein n=1 Tax=Dreissena polymorpha TaxID=45954 RepID=A0A9D4RD59_DREPO|nr:hypothetical protein DPMN_026106 [Dreissena polymorpha]
MIENFRILRQEFYEKMKSIEPWLDNTPSFSELQENRKLLRSLKSKLRHLQADKLDLEEVRGFIFINKCSISCFLCT